MIDLRLGDCLEVMRDLDAGSVDAVITDPPYPKEYQHLYGDMASEAKRVLKVGGSLVTLCGHYQVPDVLNAMCLHLRYWWIAGMGQPAGPRLPGKWVAVRFKPALWFVNERRRPGDTRCPLDFLNGEGKDKRFHEWGQDMSWFVHWIENLCPTDGIVLDPFMGGGTTGVACITTGRNFIGIEKDPSYFAIAEKRIETAAATLRQLELVT